MKIQSIFINLTFFLFKYFCISIFLLIAVLNTFDAVAEKLPPLAELISQLEGKICNYKINKLASSTICTRFKENDLGHLSRIAKDCMCRAAASECISSNNQFYKNALPSLHQYLKQGSPDLYTGSNVITCLSNVISTISKFNDNSSLPYLIEYLDSPRFVSTDTQNNIRYYSSLSPVILAIAKYGSSAKKSLPVLNKYLKKSGNEYMFLNKTELVNTIAKIGGTSELSNILLYTIKEFRTYDGAFKARELIYKFKILEEFAKEGKLEINEKDQIFDFLQEFKNTSNNWIIENEDNFKTEKVVLIGDRKMNIRAIQKIQNTLVRILAYSKDIRVVNDLPELLRSDENFDQNLELIKIYSNEAEKLAPQLFQIVAELRMYSPEEGKPKLELNDNRIKAILALLSNWSKK